MKRFAGFTLIELMVVIAVVAILSTIAITTYRSYTMRANRIDAEAVLLKVQVAEEKYFLQSSTYTTSLATLGLPTTSPTGFYTLAVAAGSSNSIASSYTATATAIGSQTNDKAACLTLSIDDQGSQTPVPSSGCWK